MRLDLIAIVAFGLIVCPFAGYIYQALCKTAVFPCLSIDKVAACFGNLFLRADSACYPFTRHAVGCMYPFDLSGLRSELLPGFWTTPLLRRVMVARYCRAGPYSPPLDVADFLTYLPTTLAGLPAVVNPAWSMLLVLPITCKPFYQTAVLLSTAAVSIALNKTYSQERY